jgi:hypothetical protein
MKTKICAVAILALAVSAFAQSGQSEGVKVKGHWTIEVRNPDGSLANRVEIQNALTPDGSRMLARVLAEHYALTRYSLNGRSAGTAPCAGVSQCTIAEPPRTLRAVPGGFAAVMEGQVTANQNGTIDEVSTGFVFCSVDLGLLCDAGIFSRATLATPVNVVAGQIVQISVAYTFL